MSHRQKQVVEKSQHYVVRNFTYAAAVLAALAILCSLWALTREWDKPLLDLHSFRQTQTAISTYYMVGTPSVFIDYITPVLGKPWRIPMEVPFYQWIVARWHELTGMGLDQSGKLFSIVFLFACIWPVWKLQAALEIPVNAHWLTMAIFLSVPLHLYWGRAFLIETMGLFLSLSMAACIFAGYQKKNWRWLLVGLAFGVFAALCKITTWALACGVTGLLVLFSNGIPKRKDFLWVAAASFAAVLPIIPGKLWLAHGDKVKNANPFARTALISSSEKQADWNFGTWEQKTNPDVWIHICRHITDQLFVSVPILGHWILPLILVAGAAASPRRIPLILIFLAGFAAGPLIFTNLYFEHNYYWVANGVWLLLALGVALACIAECDPKSRWPAPVTVSLGASVCIAGFTAWHQIFFPIIQKLPTRETFAEAWAKPIQKIVPAGRTLLILSQNWNPNAHYFAQRKGVSFPTGDNFAFDGEELQQSLTLLDLNEKLGAVVINQDFLTQENQPFFFGLLQSLGMQTNGFASPFGIVFPARTTTDQ